jgi:hypothetical protein
MYNETQIATLMTAVRNTATQPYVVEISEHFAGYFDELGIIITVRPDAKDGDIEALTEQVSDELRKYRVQFGWIVMIERAGKQVMVAVSGDR